MVIGGAPLPSIIPYPYPAIYRGDTWDVSNQDTALFSDFIIIQM